MMNGETITERYKRLGTFTTGFDYLRIALAISVVVIHSFVTSYGKPETFIVWGGS